MKRNFVIKNIIVMVLIICALGCKKLIDLDAPKTQIASSSVFKSNSTATSALLSIYSQININYPLPLYLDEYTGLSSDEFTNYGSSQPKADLYRNNLLAKDGATLPWSSLYNFIYQANAIIEGLESSTTISKPVKNQLLGESKFLRGYFYFYLTNLYGNVPLITTTDYTKNAAAGRVSSDLIYAQIVTDLNESQSLLSNNWVDASDTTATNERIRPTKWAAAALLARTYLHMGLWQKAKDASDLVISNTNQFGLESLDNVFIANNREAILQVPPSSTSGYTWEGSTFILTNGPGTGITLSDQLMNSFEPNDNREVNWVGTNSFQGKNYYYPFKYKVKSGSPPSTEYTVLLRLAEQYLIRAEAEAQLNDLMNATKDLNVIRNRAGLSNTTAGTQPELLNAIQHERQVELFSEGFRWLDLKRTGSIDAVMGAITPLKNGGTWQSFQQYYPIPPKDALKDYNLVQTPGY